MVFLPIVFAEKVISACMAVVLTPKPAPAQGRDMTRVSDKFYARQLSYCYDTEVC